MRWMFDLTWVFILYVLCVTALAFWAIVHTVDNPKVGASSLEADVVACHTEYPTEPYAFHECVDQALERVAP